MKIHVKWKIPADVGEFLIDLQDLDGGINWENMNEEEKILTLEQYMQEDYLQSYAEVVSFTEVNG